MKEVKLNSSSLSTEPVNAIIDGNTIIPGKYGKVVNERESYLKMNEFGTFNEIFYVYDYVKPEISLEDNLDKVIISGYDKKSISLIVSDDDTASILKSENIEYVKIIEDEDEIKDEEYINGNLDKEDYEELNIRLKRKKINNKICIIEESNMELCRKYGYYLVKPSKIITHNNIAELKSSINGGDIILLDESLTNNEVKLIISSIKYKNLSFVNLKNFISEE